jgi:pimeloyl-ACP methyl ester carboxylesterase
MLDRPHLVEAELVGQSHLLEGVHVDRSLGLARPGPRHRDLVEQAELHHVLLRSSAASIIALCYPAMDTRRRVVALVVVALAFLAVPDAEAQRPAVSRSGELGGADYLIEVPANWSGGLVVFAHGIQRGPGKGDVRQPPIASHITGGGHAWIASGYHAREYHPDLFIEDLVALRELFLREVGPPRWSIIYGQSMGGHIAVASLELRPGLYQGALAECGLVDGIAIADYLMAYTAAAELISGVPLLEAPDRQAFGPLLEGLVRALGMPGSYTPRGRQFDSVVKYLMGADSAGNDLPLRLQGLKPRYLPNIVHRPRDVEKETNPGLRAATNANVRYRIDPGLGITEDELNARVRRVQPLKGARSPTANPVYAERTGRITVPLLTLHETGDAWVPLSLEQSYKRRTIAAGTDHLLVQRVIRAPSHCGVDGGTRRQAFDDLVAWVERGVRPPGEDVLATDLSRIGLRYTPFLHPEDPLAPRR